VTARVTTLKGVDAGAYYVDGPGGYYLDGDEPPGRWLGRGAFALGLSHDVDDEDFLSIMDGRDPVDGTLLGTAQTERTVRGFDVTCSAPKSVSVLWAVGDDRIRKEVLDAHDAAVAAAFGWIEDHAHCRYRVNGEIWTVDADGLIAAAFRQHTSRAHDPQIHTHLVIANRVMAPDGRWLALDARTLKHDQRTVSALYAAGLRAELTGRLGVRWKPVENGQAEMADAPKDVLAEFSKRTTQMSRRRDEKVERFVDTVGRRPTARESWAIEREAAIDSRPSKASADAADLHALWHDQLDALGYTPDDYLARVTGRTRPLEPDGAIDRTAVIDALSSLRDTQSVWRPAEITREIAAALPTRLGSTAAEVVARVDRLASHARTRSSSTCPGPFPPTSPSGGTADPSPKVRSTGCSPPARSSTRRSASSRSPSAGATRAVPTRTISLPTRTSRPSSSTPRERWRGSGAWSWSSDLPAPARPPPCDQPSLASTPNVGRASAWPPRPRPPRCSPSTPGSTPTPSTSS
jgi:conjugative relaxase-like TrwC/TraI family protein